MIGQMAVGVTADRANLPLGTLFVRAGSAANIALVGVPVRPGVNVTALALRVENVDGATADYAARAIGGVWVVDVPASHVATVGSVTGGVSVWATGTGADGETSRTWCVGVGDLEVLTADADAPAPAPGQTFWPLRMFDAAPASPTKYNAYLAGVKLMVYDGAAWVEISGDVADAVTREGTNPVKSSGIWSAIWGALAALPSRFASLYDWCVAQLAGKRGLTDLAVYADAWSLLLAGASDRLVLLPTPQAGYWTDTGTLDGRNSIRFMGDGFWRLYVADGTRGVANDVPEGAAEITFLDAELESEVVAVATKQVAATSDTLAKTSQLAQKQDALSAQQLAAVNSGATAAKVATWDGYAEQIAGKASAADLRYRIAEYATTGAKLPDNVAYVIVGGTTYQASALTLSEETDIYILWGNDSDLGVTWDSTGALIGNPFDAVFYDSSDTPFSDVPNLLVPRVLLADRTVNLITAQSGIAASIDIELPAAVTVDGVSYARDFFLDIDNSANSSDLALEFTALGVDYAFVPLEDDSVSEMMTISSGERVRLYFTETPYTATGSLPVINVARVTLGDFVTSTATQGGN